MSTTSHRDPAVLVAGLVASALWVGTAVLSTWANGALAGVDRSVVRTFLPHPNGTVPDGSALTGQTILAALLAGAVVAATVHVATRRLPRRTGALGVLLATWFGVVVGGALASVADTVADIVFPAPMNPTFHLLVASFDGAWWGLLDGWVVGLAVVGARALTGRRPTTEDLPATRRARKPVRTRAYPAMIAAGTTAVCVWAATGAAGSWLVWHRKARGAIDLVGEVAPGSMILRLTPQSAPVQTSEIVLGVGVGVVVALGTWLAARRLPPRLGRWTLLLAVWFATLLGALLAAAARSLTTYAPSGLHATTLDLVMPSVQASVFWPLATGWCAGLLAALVHARTGVRAVVEPVPDAVADPGEPIAPTAATVAPDGPAKPTKEGPETPDAAPRSAVHTDAEERSLIP